MVYVISLEKLTDLRLNLWSHDVLGEVSSEQSVPLVLLDLTLQQFPQVVEFIHPEELLSRLINAFANRKDRDYFKYTVENDGKFEGNFYVNAVQTLG